MSDPTSKGTVPWPPEFAELYRARGYWEDTTIGDVVRAVADEHPERVAVVDGDVRLSYRELVERADAAATRLRDLGLAPDDRILVQLPNGWEFIVLTLACFRSGIVPVMALPAHRRHELSHLAGVSQSRAIAVPRTLRGFDHEALALQLVEELPDLATVLSLAADEPSGETRVIDLGSLLDAPTDADDARRAADAMRPDPDAPACFLISGGTTGLPKLITRTHNDYVCNVRATSATAELGPDDVYLGTLPVSHNFPLACPGVLGALFVGARVVMLPSPEPVRVFAAIEAEGVTVAAAVPAVAQRWMDHQEEVGGDQLRTLRLLQVGGSRLPDEHAARVKPVLGATLQQVFGMAEGLINTTRLDDPDDVVIGTQGRPVHEADEVRILDPLGEDVPDGTPGAIFTRGPYTPRGYYNAAEHNARAFVDGWYGSGDVVVRRPDGNLVVHGRDKDMINRGGEKISAEEIEDLMYRLGSLELVAAVAMPDPVLGERLCVYVVPKPGHQAPTIEQVREAFDQRGVAAYKFPERLEVVGELPMTKVGKINKKALREDIATRLDASTVRS
jgi:2,3-dihydroxybenzoate-AMP ligase